MEIEMIKLIIFQIAFSLWVLAVLRITEAKKSTQTIILAVINAVYITMLAMIWR